MTRKKVGIFLLVYAVFSLLSYYLAIGGDFLYFSERETNLWYVYHGLFTLLFTITCFNHFEAKITAEIEEKTILSSLFMSLFLLLIVLGYISVGFSFIFHSMVPFWLRIMYLFIELSQLFMTIFIFISMFIASVKAIQVQKNKKQQES